MHPGPIITLEPDDNVVCIGNSTGISASIEPDSGYVYSYLWSTGETTDSIHVAPDTATYYSVTVTNDQGCVDIDSILIGVNELPIASVIAIDTSICEGSSTTLTASVDNPSGLTYSYSWSNGDVGASITVAPSVSTTYVVTLTDSNFCSDTASITVVVFDPTIDDVLKNTDIGCDGTCEGSFTVYVDYGLTGDYDILYDYNGTTVNFGPFASDSTTVNKLCAGSYTNIRIQSLATGCLEVFSGGNIIIEETGADWQHVTKVSDVSDCNGTCDGSFIVDANLANTGEFMVSYLYNGSLVQLGPYNFAGDITIDNLCAGTYSDITITSVASGCFDVWPTDIVIAQPNPDAAVVSHVDDTCLESNGTATVSVSGGAWPYTITWVSEDGTVFGSGTQNVPGNFVISGLPGGMTYCITVTDSNGCDGE